MVARKQDVEPEEMSMNMDKITSMTHTESVTDAEMFDLFGCSIPLLLPSMRVQREFLRHARKAQAIELKANQDTIAPVLNVAFERYIGPDSPLDVVSAMYDWKAEAHVADKIDDCVIAAVYSVARYHSLTGAPPGLPKEIPEDTLTRMTDIRAYYDAMLELLGEQAQLGKCLSAWWNSIQAAMGIDDLASFMAKLGSMRQLAPSSAATGSPATRSPAPTPSSTDTGKTTG